jgi:uncharacterized repeat protein (TIGR01451 family)
MSTPRPTISRISGLSRLAILFTVLAVGANAFYTTTLSKKSSSGRLPEVAKTDNAIKAVGGKQSLLTKINEELSPANTSLPAFMPQAVLPPSAATYDGTCTTPKDTFELGDTVCVKTTGFNVTSPAQVSVTLSDPASEVLARTDLDNSANVTFTLPTNGVTITDGVSVDNRGTWAVKVVPAGRYVVRANAVFTVTDPANKAADVSVYNISQSPGSEAQAGANTTFELYVVNNGPDAAQNVSVTHSVLANATFVSQSQDASLPLFSCTNPSVGSAGTSTCTVATLPKGSKTLLTFVYQVDAGATKGTVVTATTQRSTSTTDLDANNNSWTARATVTGAAPEDVCNLGCPEDMTVTANTTGGQNNEPGAVVNFAVESSGTCGAITSTPASGSFFPVGQTPVTVTSADGGGSCSFTVTVLGTAAPTIDCPDDVTATAADGACEATVNNIGTPTTTPTGLEVTAVRSDGRPLDDQYPGGETIITWTATDENGRTASCPQKVTVTVNDTTPPTVTAPPNVTIATLPGAGGSCGTVVGESELGTPEASDNCNVTVIRTGVPAGNFFPLGPTTITYQAKDGAGNLSQPAYQTVTITDGTPPIIEAPADASYTCLSDVPAPNPALATGGDVYDSNGHLLPPGPPSDNCGVPTVTAADTSSTGAGSASDPRIITRTYTATDAAGNTASDTQIITVIDNTPPSIALNGDSSMTVECHTSFTDPGASASDNCAGATVAVSGSVDVNTPNTYTLSYTATDWAGNQSQPVTRTVIVVDTIAPTINLNGQNITFWPPNHAYRTVNVTDLVASVTDSCDTTLAVSSVVISKVTSDETENGNGDGNTFNDIVIAANCKSVQLRAERNGGGNGRVYTITFKVKDASGNVGTTTAQVKVPKSNGGAAVDDGPSYTVNGNCP